MTTHAISPQRQGTTGTGVFPVRAVWVVWLLFNVTILGWMFPSFLRQTVESLSTEPVIATLKWLGLEVSTWVTIHIASGLVLGAVFVAVSSLIVWSSNSRTAVLFGAGMIPFGVFSLSTDPGQILSLSAHPLAVAAAYLLSFSGWMFFCLLFFLFPDGKFKPRWGILGAIISSVYVVTWSLPTGSPFHVDSWPPALGFFSLVVMSILWISPQVIRYQIHADDRQRQQIKWVLLGIVVALIIVAGFAVFSIIWSAIDPEHLSFLLLADDLINTVAIIFLPLGIGIALLRGNLWDVNFMLNRATVFGSLTIVLGFVFLGGFFLVQEALLLLLGSGQTGLAAALSGAAAVALFNPTRLFVTRQVDKRLFGIALSYEPVRRRATPASAGTPGSFAGYTRLELLGRGGMGEVYKAEQPSVNRLVAIKLLSSHLRDEQDFKQRFLREAQAIAALKHPNIVSLYDFGELDGQPYMVMEYIHGHTLASILKEQGKLPLDRCRSVLGEVAAALDYAHGQGIIHRDIKPSNIMLEDSGMPDRPPRAVLMDFGIAKIAAETQLTRSGGMVGTLDYIAPEQIQGAAQIDGRADVYAMGVMAFQMLTGTLPFQQNNPAALMLAHLMQPAPDPRNLEPSLPPDVSLAILRALEKKPTDRFDSAGTFAAALQRE